MFQTSPVRFVVVFFLSILKNSGCADAASMIAGDVRQFDRRVPYAEMVARIDAITTKEIQAVSQFLS